MANSRIKLKKKNWLQKIQWLFIGKCQMDLNLKQVS